MIKLICLYDGLNFPNPGLNFPNPGLNELKDYMDFKSNNQKNLWHLRNQNKSVILTKSADILNSILEMI